MNNLYFLIILLLAIIIILNFMFILKINNCNINENFFNSIDLQQSQQTKIQQQGVQQQDNQQQGLQQQGDQQQGLQQQGLQQQGLQQQDNQQQGLQQQGLQQQQQGDQEQGVQQQGLQQQGLQQQGVQQQGDQEQGNQQQGVQQQGDQQRQALQSLPRQQEQQTQELSLNLITLFNKNTQPVIISNQTPIGTPSNQWAIPDFNENDPSAQWIWYKSVSNNDSISINNPFTNALLIGVNNNLTLKYPLTLNIICDAACMVFLMNETGINNVGYVSSGPNWQISTKFTLSRLSQSSIFIFLLANFGKQRQGGFICSLQDSSNPVNIVFNSNIKYFPNWSVWAS